MSTTVTLELSDMVAEALATPEGQKRAQELLEAGFSSANEEDVMVGPPPTQGPIPISRESMDKIIALSQAPAREPGPGLLQALENHRRLSGEG